MMMWTWRSTHVPVAAMFMLLAPLLLLTLPASSACHPTERQALLGLMSSMHRAHRTPPYGWPGGSSHFGNDCCALRGVKCDATTGRVRELFLCPLETDDDAPEWKVNSSIFSSFPELTQLGVDGYGIGDSLAAFVSGLIGLKNLRALYLRRNSLIGQVPAALGNLSNIFSSFPELIILDLGYNRIGGSLAAFVSGLTRLKNLRSLYLSGNSLTGQVPASLGNFSSILSSFPELTELELGDNRIGGSLAAFVSGLTGLKNLRSLNLNGNSLTEQVPVALGNLSGIFSSFPELTYLYLDDNRIGGSLAAFVSGLTGLKNLRSLGLRGNSLTEQVPATLGNLSSIFSSFPELTELYLSHNRIGGSLAAFVSGLTGLKNLRSLYLSRNSLTEQVPAALGNLSSIFSSFPQLTDLDLGDNMIGGSLVVFVSGLTGLKNLGYLSLSGNSLTGQVPATLGNLSSLSFLFLGDNHLTGEIPSSAITGLALLEELDLSDNSFTGELDLPSRPMLKLWRIDLSVNSIGGSIPGNLSSMFPSLVCLNLSMNWFTGNIPPALFDPWLQLPPNMNRPQVGYLDLSHNQLGGPLVYDNTSLYFLRLSNNSLYGVIPKCLPPVSLLDGNNFTTFPTTMSDSLRIFDVHHNQLSGNLPPSIWNQSELVVLNLRENQLYGEIPQQLCNLASLTFLDLSQNNLSGTLPSCPHQLGLQHLNLAGNALTGSIVGTFFNSTALWMLDLGKNAIFDDLNWIKDLQNIRILALSHNHFKGLVPVELCSLQYLHLLDLSHNNLSGLIPSCLVNTSLGRKGEEDPHEADFWVVRGAQIEIPFYSAQETISMMDTKGNNYVYEDIEFGTKGRSYLYRRQLLSLLLGVDFSANQLTGQIPLELGQLVRINVLNLSYNQLIGSIPATLSNLQHLESMDISHNKLTGHIPNELVKLTYLEVFSVAYNNLSGCTPGWNAQFSTFNSSSYEGNTDLHGLPMDDSCKPNSFEPPMFSQEGYHSGRNDNIDNIILYVVSIASFVVFFWITLYVLHFNQGRRQIFFHMVDQGFDICHTWIVAFRSKF